MPTHVPPPQVTLLDSNQSAGWDFLDQLLKGERPAADLLLHGFLAA